jgi:hypothetical protein
LVPRAPQNNFLEIFENFQTETETPSKPERFKNHLRLKQETSGKVLHTSFQVSQAKLEIESFYCRGHSKGNSFAVLQKVEMVKQVEKLYTLLNSKRNVKYWL